MWILPWLAAFGFAFSATIYLFLFGMTRNWRRLAMALLCVLGTIVAGYFATATIKEQPKTVVYPLNRS